MKVKFHLQKGETLEDAEEFLVKALQAKAVCEHGERYSTPALNKLHDVVCNEFNLASTNSLIAIEEIIRNATGTKRN